MILTEEHAKAYGMLRLKMPGVDVHRLVNLHAGVKTTDGYKNALALLRLKLKNNSGDALLATLPAVWDRANAPARYFAFKRWNAALVRARAKKGLKS